MSGPSSQRGLHVLVVDDSAVVRQMIPSLLGDRPGWRITTAADPLIALSKMARERPDVILLDLQMPRMSGLEFLRRVMSDDPIPVVVCSSYAQEGTREAFEALDLGAVDLIAKPQVGVREFLAESQETLVETLRAASQARLRRPSNRSGQRAAKSTTAISRPAPAEEWDEGALIAIGASTGGPEALRLLLSVLPRNLPPLAIVQHMPPKFTAAFAERLDQDLALAVHEAEEGMVLSAGTVVIAPGGRHLGIERRGGTYVAHLSDAPPVNRHRPSVDVLFDSVAQAAGRAGIGAILTGMGSDGARGLAAMRSAGAATFAQDEASSVVFGMPREAVALGGVGDVVSLERMPWALQLAARRRARG